MMCTQAPALIVRSHISKILNKYSVRIILALIRLMYNVRDRILMKTQTVSEVILIHLYILKVLNRQPLILTFRTRLLLYYIKVSTIDFKLHSFEIFCCIFPEIINTL